MALLIAADWLDADDERLTESAAGGARAQGALRCFGRTSTTSPPHLCHLAMKFLPVLF